MAKEKKGPQLNFPEMDKKQAFAFLKQLEAKGVSLGLSKTKRFLCALGNPEKGFSVIHIAGTNGKGSTAAMVESILRKAGYNTAMYSSPHLVKLNERFVVNGKQISDKTLIELVSELKQVKKQEKITLTHFEFITCLAFVYFARNEVDFAVIEVGLGGRLDATNVVKPCVSVITNVEKEHEKFLGRTVEKIARAKAGIIKKGVPLVTAEWKKQVLTVFRKECAEKGAVLSLVETPFKGKLGLLGGFQRWNAALAVAAVKELRSQGFVISEAAVKKGLALVKWPGRFDVIKGFPTIVLDCCHTPGAAFVLREAFQSVFPKKKAVLVVGVSSDKKLKAMAEQLAIVSKKVVATEAEYKPMPASLVKSAFEGLGKDTVAVSNVGVAIKLAVKEAGRKGIVLVCGSCFVVGGAIQALKKAR